MTNKYPGKCRFCGSAVEAGAGELTGSRAAGWKISHLPGQCPAPQKAESMARHPAASKPAELGLYRRDGRLYVIREFEPDGKGGRVVRFARELVPTERAEADRASQGDGHGVKVKGVKAPGMQWELLPEEALSIEEARELGIKFGECLLCGTGIETKASVEDRGGIGPVCIKKQRALLLLKQQALREAS